MSVPSEYENGGYSSTVRATLHIAGHGLPIAKLRPGQAVLRESATLSERNAEIELSVDGDAKRWKVTLLEDLRSDRLVVHFC